MNSVYRMADIDENLRIAGLRPLDVLVVGGTGAGKSSTLNTLFQRRWQKWEMRASRKPCPSILSG